MNRLHIPRNMMQNQGSLNSISHMFPTTKLNDIIVDVVSGDGDCFFTSIFNQFKDVIGHSDRLLPHAQRMFVHNYMKQNMSILIDNVGVWKTMYLSDKPNSPEWAFFKPYADLNTDDYTIANKMLKTGMFLDKSFYAEHYSIGTIILYLRYLLHKNVGLYIVDTDMSQPSLLSLDKDTVDVYTFLIRSHNHYSSVSIEGKRLFTPTNLPKLSVGVSHIKQKSI